MLRPDLSDTLFVITTPRPNLDTRTEPAPVAVAAFDNLACEASVLVVDVAATAVVGVAPSVADDAVGAVTPPLNAVRVGTLMLEMVGLMVPVLATPGTTPVAVSAGAGARETVVGVGIDAELAVTAGAPPTTGATTAIGALTVLVGLATAPAVAAAAGAGVPATVAKLVNPLAAAGADATAVPAPASPAISTGLPGDVTVVDVVIALMPIVAPAELPVGDTPLGATGPNTRP